MPTPLIIITGFLGAGKTTFLNYWLSLGFDGRRVAVVVNDFGQIMVDASLIKHAQKDLLELRQGCVCCSLAGDLSRGLEKLLQAGNYSLLLLETSGITSLRQLKAALQSPALAALVSLRQIITVVDAVRFPKLAGKIEIVRDQAAGADLILLNRCDQVDSAQIAACRQRLAELNPAAPIVETRFGRCPVSVLDTAPVVGSTVAGESGRHPHSTHAVWHSCSVFLSAEIEVARLQAALAQLPEAIYRIKGILSQDDKRWLIEKIGNEVKVTLLEKGAAASGEENILVVLSPTPAQAAIRQALSSVPGIVRVE